MMSSKFIIKEYSIVLYPKTNNFNNIKNAVDYSKFLLERELYIIDLRSVLCECGFEHISTTLSDLYYRGTDSAVALFWLTYSSPLLDHMEIQFESFLRSYNVK
jgi:hypothetical protein